jgi:murein DD-endopeptidase MepM/ murein hydrolase activator NlpD
MTPVPWQPRVPRRPRPLVMQGTVTTITLCVIVMALVATVTINDPSLAAVPGQAFNALASSFAVKPANSFSLYRVRPGDTIEGIAKRFNVSIGGIYELNKMYSNAEITIGQLIKIPNDPSYGASFKPGLPPTPPPASSPPLIGSAPKGTIYSYCVYCSVGGYTTGGGPCAPHASAITGFGLINPNPNSHWVRGYTWYHSGVDISTGQYGTPIIAAQSGQVIFSGWDPYGGGYSVKVNHCWGIATSYSHMEKILVSLGQYVYKGQVVGLQGSTGNSTGPHLHFMTWWDNNPFDPLCAYGTIDGASSSSHYGGCP